MITNDDFDATDLLLEASDLIRAAELLHEAAQAEEDVVRQGSEKARLLTMGFEAHRQALRGDVRSRKITLRALGLDLQDRCSRSLSHKEMAMDDSYVSFDPIEPRVSLDSSFYSTRFSLLEEELDRTRLAMRKVHEFFRILNDVPC